MLCGDKVKKLSVGALTRVEVGPLIFYLQLFLKALSMNKSLSSSFGAALVVAISAFAFNAQAASHAAAAPAAAASGAKHAKGHASGAKHAKGHASGAKHSAKAASKPEMKKEEGKK